MSEVIESDPIVYVSTFQFGQTLERVVSAIEASGMILFAEIDHASNAREFGLNMLPTTVLLFGHPNAGTPAMVAVPNVALELPLRVLVRLRGDGRTELVFHPFVSMLRSAGVPEALAARVRSAQDLLLTAVSP